MKITIENIPPEGEEEIIIRMNQLSPEILALIQGLKTDRHKLNGYHPDGSFSPIHPKDVYYFETVDNKVFAYGQKEVLEVKLRLYELEKRLGGGDFIRVSKSMILNLSKVKRFSPSLSGRFEAILLNHEKVLISRQYVPEIKNRLEL